LFLGSIPADVTGEVHESALLGGEVFFGLLCSPEGLILALKVATKQTLSTASIAGKLPRSASSGDRQKDERSPSRKPAPNRIVGSILGNTLL
jgi:hypothetical protein